MIDVQPAQNQRRAFAKWAIAQTPRVETSGANTSAVPNELFASIPEELLVGAYVDGTLYRHVVEGHEPEGRGYKPAPDDTDNPEEDPAAVAVDAVADAVRESVVVEETPAEEAPAPPTRRTRKSSAR